MSERYAFTAWDYGADAQLRPVPYVYVGDCAQGWEITRAGAPYLTLGAGYVAVASRFCGICATDLQREHLPFALPQVTGHELVGEFAGRAVAVEINASHWHRGVDCSGCWWCQHGFANHCPQRLTLGIDRLPGGFAPWVLAPRRALHELPATLSPELAILVEPLAAALRATQLSPPQAGRRVAVLGCGRLGLLLIAALAWQRRTRGLDFSICALLHRPGGDVLPRLLGADQVGLSSEATGGAFDLVYETSGSAQGFLQALRLARQAIHVKSTSGQGVAGLANLTRLVINEYQLAARPPTSTDAPGGAPAAAISVPGLAAVDAFLQSATASTILRPAGLIALAGRDEDSELGRALAAGTEIQGSRCGDFAPAIALLANEAAISAALAEHMIIQDLPVARLPQAFAAARRSGALKVRIFH